jgi:dimethylargininase
MDSFSGKFSSMLTAITRKVSVSLANCELSFIARQTIDLDKARAQHHAYEEALAKLGARVISLPEQPDLPDSMFVEDPAIVLDELAVICAPGSEARRKEVPTLAAELQKYRRLEHVKLPGTLEGGDVFRVGKKLFVGLTARTNAEGIRQLAVIVEKHGYDVTAVPVSDCLHLKSAVTGLARNTLLANRAWFKWARLEGLDWLDVDPTETHAGNALALAGTVLFPASFPKTREKIEARGFRVLSLDISELQKAESGLTCSSLIFQA